MDKRTALEERRFAPSFILVPMRILVTGGAGFIGSAVVDALVDRGDAVVVLDDLSTGSLANVNPAAHLVDADITAPAALGRVAGAFDAVAHFAAKTKVVESIEKPDLYRRVILDGTANVLRLAEQRGARAFVNVSSGGAGYGETPIAATEDASVAAASPYGRFKFEAERLFAGTSLRAVTLRLANVYGPRQRSDLEGGVVAIFEGCWAKHQPLTIFGDGTAERDYVYVGDIAAATLAAIDRAVEGAYNIGTGVATSVNALVAAMTEVHGPPPEIRHAPPRAGEIQRSLLDSSKAGRAGLWRPAVTLAQGLRLSAAARPTLL